MDGFSRRLSAHGSRISTSARGFTLIELLAGMAVLSILIVLMAQFVNVGMDAWDHGMRQAENTSSAQAALGFIAAELSTAIAREKVTFSQIDDHPTYFSGDPAHESDALMFVSVSRSPDSSPPARAGMEIVYYIDNMTKDKVEGGTEAMPDRYRLVRSVQTSNGDDFFAYRLDDWTAGIFPENHKGKNDTIVENISAFQVRAYADVTSTTPVDYYESGGSTQLPAYVDIYLETLSESDAKRAALMPLGTRAGFVKKWSRGYGTRVHFKNRNGYIRGG